MPKGETFWEQLDKECHDIAPEVGALTGAAYGLGAATVTDNADVAKGVASMVGGFVADHWGDTCDLPANLGDSFSNLTPSDSSLAPAADTSPAPSDSVGQDI
jgi:hypothetical protein